MKLQTAGAERPATDRTFAGTQRFEVVGELGAGGMGVVHEVFDRQRNVRVALKTLRHMGPRALLLFKDEFRAARDLSHPNVIRLGELVEDEGRWLFTMELVRGDGLLAYVGQPEPDAGGAPPFSDDAMLEASTNTRTIAPALLAVSGTVTAAERGPLEAAPSEPVAPRFDEARLRSVLAQLASALHALHGRGIIHRDIKPSNVLVTQGGRAVLLDFGVALAGTEGPATFELVGSPAFMAPEQLKNPVVGPAADWYAFGTLLFCALTGFLPFRGPTEWMVAAKLDNEAPDVDTYVLDLPADLSALCRDLLRRDPSARPPAEDILRRLGVRIQTDLNDVRLRVPFVGRESELAALQAAFARTRQGTPGAVFIEGESGIGKSACVDEFLSRITRRRAKVLVLRGRCHEREAVPYKAFDSIVDGLARVLMAHPRWLPDDLKGCAPLVRIFPVLASVKGLAQPDEAPCPAGGDVRELAFPALRRLLSSVAARRRVVLFVDDAQWADSGSLTLLTAVFGADLRTPLFMVATARPADDGRPCEAFDAVQTYATRLPLSRLSEEDARALVQEVMGQLPPDVAASSDDVARAAGGHPMFIGELALHASQNRGASTQAVNLNEAIRIRVARLDADARRLVETAAVAGVPITHLAARRVTGLDAQTYADVSEKLVSQRLLLVTGHSDQDTVHPYHDRVREAVVAPLDAEVLRRLQAALGEALEGCGAAPALIAAFYDAAGERVRAGHFAEQAASRAEQALAFDRAADFYAMALGGVDANATERLNLLTKLATVLKHAGRRDQSAAAFEAAAELADPQARLALKGLAGDQLLTGGYVARGWIVLREAMDTLRVPMPSSTLRSGLLAARHLLALSIIPLRWKPATAAQKQGRDAVRADIVYTVSAGLAMVDTVHGVGYGLMSARLCLALGDPLRLSRSLCAASMATAALGLGTISARFSAAAARAAKEDGGPQSLFYAESCVFLRTFLIDHNWSHTLQLHTRIEAHWHAAGKGCSSEMDVVDQFASWALCNQGHYAQLRNRVHRLVSGANRAGNPFLSTSLRTYHSLLFLAEDRPDAAENDLEEALKTWPPGEKDFQLPQAWALFSRAEILLYRGEAQRRETLTPRYRELTFSLLDQINWVRARRDHTQVRLCLAHAAMSEGKIRTRALRHARRWLARLRRQGSPTARAWTSLSEAAVAHLRGNMDAAHAALRTAIRLTYEQDLGAFAEAARYRLAQTDGGPNAEGEMSAVLDLLRARGVKEPLRMLVVLAPGWATPNP